MEKISQNFSQSEIELLISVIENKINIIENEKSDAATWQEKEMAWNVIEKEFNAANVGIFREAKHLKIKYEALKMDTKKKLALAREEQYKTGGGASSAARDLESQCAGPEVITPTTVKDILDEESTIDWSKPATHLIDSADKEGVKESYEKYIDTKSDVNMMQRKILEDELLHKQKIHKLELKQSMLKVKILEKELETMNQNMG